MQATPLGCAAHTDGAVVQAACRRRDRGDAGAEEVFGAGRGEGQLPAGGAERAARVRLVPLTAKRLSKHALRSGYNMCKRSAEPRSRRQVYDQSLCHSVTSQPARSRTPAASASPCSCRPRSRCRLRPRRTPSCTAAPPASPRSRGQCWRTQPPRPTLRGPRRRRDRGRWRRAWTQHISVSGAAQRGPCLTSGHGVTGSVRCRP